jgi:hypothetical protein
MRVRLVAGLCLAGSVMPVLAAAQDGSGDAGSRWAAIVECGAERSAAARHECVDRELRAVGVLSEARVAQETREAFGRENRAEAPPPPRAVAAAPSTAAAPPAASAPRPAAAAPVAAAAPAPPAAIDRIDTSVAAVRTIGYRRLRVTTADGSVWDQTRDETFNTRPRVGDSFTVERASLGSFQCRFARASNYRCERVD